MPHDPVRAAEVRAWLGKAANDVRGAEIDLDASPPLIEDALFHCQQAAEKSLKAFLAWHDRAFRKTHSIEEIGAACVAIDGTLESLVDRAAPLSEYAWAFRYPGDPEVPSLVEARDALALAREVHGAILARLPPETGS